MHPRSPGPDSFIFLQLPFCFPLCVFMPLWLTFFPNRERENVDGNNFSMKGNLPYILIGAGSVALYALLIISMLIDEFVTKVALYKSVDYIEEKREIEGISKAEYLVTNGRLYLRKDRRQTIILLSCFWSYNWNASSIAQFRKEHPELEHLWPDPIRPDGGVKWIEK